MFSFLILLILQGHEERIDVLQLSCNCLPAALDGVRCVYPFTEFSHGGSNTGEPDYVKPGPGNASNVFLVECLSWLWFPLVELAGLGLGSGDAIRAGRQVDGLVGR